MTLDKIERVEWNRKGVQKEGSIRSVRFFMFAITRRRYARPVRHLPKSRGIQPSSNVRICR